MWEWKVAAGGNNYPKLGECRIMEGITAAELYGKAIAGNGNWSDRRQYPRARSGLLLSYE